VGELAAHTGISVKTLHHYDEAGLLSPSAKSGAGYRLYDEKDLERLQQILSLKALGLSLEQIKAAIENRDFSPQDVLQTQFLQMKEQLASQQDLVERLDGMLRLLQSRKSMTAQDFLDAIAMMQTVESYYTPEQREEIRERANVMGHEKIVQGEQDWQTLIAAVKAEMDKGTDPSDPKVRKLAKKWMNLVNQFTGGNSEIENNLRRMYEENPNAGAQFGGPDPGIMEYIKKARKSSK
jgi:DNA-binding transcriptional MerR regulator